MISKLKYLIALCLSISFHLWFGAAAYAQNPRKLRGNVIDSTRTAIADASVLLIIGKDTLLTVSDKDGSFSFQRIKASRIRLKVSRMGYTPYNGSFEFKEKESLLSLAPIVLASEGMLKEVIILGKVKPVRVMKDTVEFNAAAYQVLAGDKVSDLLKQLPGVEVDDDDNVSTMGKEMVKLRVNGKDFFTDNVKDFIGKLPASIVAKIQVIDDYGDEANFTGIKTGEPVKMLNIVTKPGMDKGVFGQMGLRGGTNNLIGGNANINIWGKNQQIGSGFNTSRSDNGAGQSKSSNGTASYRRQFKDASLGFNYSFNLNHNDSENISFIETVNSMGTIYSENNSRGENSRNSHNLNWNFQQNNRKDFLNANVNLSFGRNEGLNNSSNLQSGIIKQDLINESNLISRSPAINASFSWTKKLAKKGQHVSASFNVQQGQRLSAQNIKSNILYYFPVSNALAKDSLLNRLIDTKNKNMYMNGSFSYNIPLKPSKDSLVRRSLNAGYNFTVNNNDENILTYVTDSLHRMRYVDSLSTQYESVFLSQHISLSYAFANKKLNYFLGASVRPNILTGDYQNPALRIKHKVINYAPNFNLSYRPGVNKTISVRYAGNSNSPNADQLQPVRNTQDLQNLIIGNPDLKPSFSHSLNFGFNQNNPKSGRLLQLNVGASTVQNQIVSNVVLLRDTLNSLRQETRYENADGTYNLNANYAYSLPLNLNKHKLNIAVTGNFGYNRAIVFTDNVKFFNKGLNFNQAISSRLDFKESSLSANVSYTFNTNNYTLIKDRSRNIETWNFSLSARATFFKSYKIGANMAKRINTGYTLANTNPLIMNATFSKRFLKNKSLSLSFQAYDLLNQGNNLARYISGNSTIDSRTNQVTRYFTFGLNYSLQQFGGSRNNPVIINTF